LFATSEDVLQWVLNVAYDIGFVTVIMRSDTNTGKREMTLFVLIGCERS